MANAQGRPARPRGITLVELLLVLTLLVIVGSLAAPAVTSSFASVRLRRAGDKVITCWSQARARAIETGVPCQFRFAPETGQGRVEPWSINATDDPAVASAVDPTISAGAGGTADPAAAIPLTSSAPDAGDAADIPVVDVELPEPITYHSGEAQVEDPLSHERRVDPSAASTGASWSTPILFFPDGSTSHAAIVLANDRQQYVRITLRGLTGTARASAVLTRDELDRTGRAR